MTLTSAVLILISAVVHAAWNLLGKREHPTPAFFLAANTIGCLCLTPAVLAYGRGILEFPASVWLLIALTGICQAVYMSSLADHRGYADPDAWIPHSDFRSRTAQVCRQRGFACQGTVNVPSPAEESEPEPYRPDPASIREEVEQVNQEQYDGQMGPEAKRELQDELSTKYAGAL